MPPTTKNLGIVKAIHVGASAPSNTKMLWYNTGDDLHYYYNVGSASWVLLTGGGAPVTSVNGYTGVVVLDADDIDDTATTNKFYASTLFDADFAGKDTDDLAEGSTNLYWTAARFTAALSAADTDGLSEGSSNLYFTNARARAAISGLAPISYNSSTGQIGITQATALASGYLSSTDWNTFNNKMDAPSGTLNKIARFTPSGSQLGDSILEDDGTRLGINTAATSGSYIRAVFTGGLAGDYELWKSSFATVQGGSSHMHLTTSSATSDSHGIYNVLSGATARGYAIKSAAIEASISSYSTLSYAGIIGEASHSTLDAIGVVGNVNGSNTADNIAGYFKVSNSGSGGAYTLRLVDGVDNTGKFVKILDSDGNVTFETVNVGDVVTLSQTENFLTKWTANAGEITSSQIEDDGNSIAIGTTLSATYYLSIDSASIESGIDLHVSASSGTVHKALNILIDDDAVTAQAKYGIDVAARNADINIGGYFLVDAGNTPSYDALTYDLIDPGNTTFNTALYAIALSNASDNYGVRVRADQDVNGDNVGIHIRTRNTVGTSAPIVIDSGNQQAGYVLTTDANGRADWAAIAAGVGDVLIGTSEDNNYLTKWDSAGASQITSSQIQDNGTTLSIGATLNAGRYINIATSAAAINNVIYASTTSTSGNNTAIYGEATGATGGINVGGHFKATGAGTNYALRVEDGNNNAGKFLKVIDASGNVSFGSEAGLGTVTDEGGTGGTLHYITKWTAFNEIGDSAIVEHATAGTIGINGAAQATSRLYVLNNDEAVTNGLYVSINDASATTLHRAASLFVTSSNTAINEGIKSKVIGSTLQNIAGYYISGSVEPTASITAANIGKQVGLVGYGSAGASDNATGAYFGAKENTSGRNYGLIVEATNGGAGDWFAMKIIDGNQAAGYVLTSDADGNAYWASATASAISGSGTPDRVARWTAGTVLGDSTIRDDGSGKIAINDSLTAGVFVKSTSNLQNGYSHSTTYAGSGSSFAAILANTGTRGTGVNYGLHVYSQNNTVNNVGIASTVNTSTLASTANEDISFHALGVNVTGHTYYGIKAVASGAGTANIAGYFKSSGATTNYAIFADGGKVRFDNLTTAATVGAVLAATNVNGEMDWKVLTATDVGAVDGSGTTGYVPRWTSAEVLGNSTIRDNGSTVGINAAPSGSSQIYTTSSLVQTLTVDNTASTVGNNIGIVSSAFGTGTTNFAIAGSASGATNNVGGNFTAGGGGYGAVSNADVGVYAAANGSTVDQYAIYAISIQAGSVQKVGIAVNVANGSSNYAAWLQDGTEGSGKFLKSVTADGKANWASLTAADISDFTNGSGTTFNTNTFDLGGPLTANASITGASTYSMSLGTSGSKLTSLSSYTTGAINLVATGGVGVGGTATAGTGIVIANIYEKGISANVNNATSGEPYGASFTIGGFGTATVATGVIGASNAGGANTIGIGVQGNAFTSGSIYGGATSIGVRAMAASNSGYAGDTIAFFGFAQQSSVNDNYGIVVDVVNAGAGDAYIGRLQDGSEGAGKFLKSIDANGTAQWATLTASDISGGVTDSTAIHNNIANEIQLITFKGSPVGADVMLIEDSAAAYAKKAVLLQDLPFVDGSGLANYVAYWSDTDTLTNTSGTTSIKIEPTQITIGSSTYPDTLLSVGSALGYVAEFRNNKSSGTTVAVKGTSQSTSSIGIGGHFEVNNATTKYALWLQDDTEGVGKFLKSITADGKANWADIEGVDVSVSNATTASSSSLTVNVDSVRFQAVTALAANMTINAPTGTAQDGMKLEYRIKDNGTSRTLTWNAAFRAVGLTLPTATTISKTLYVGFIYNNADSKWDCVAVKEEA